MKTLTVLGGGSAYTPGLLQALIAHADTLPLTTVRLFDTDPWRLEVVARLTAAMARQAGVFQVIACDTLEAAMQGTDLVLNSSRPGGLEARRIDETLPLEFDIPGQETVGPGGFFFALRSVPEALRVADLLQALAPQATLLNYTNPSNIVTQALVDRGGIQVIGLCDQSDEDLQSLAHALGRTGAYRFRSNGLNHGSWYSDIAMGDAPLPDLGRALPAPASFDAEHRLRFELSQQLARLAPGCWPNSYLPYYRYPLAFVEQARRLGPRSDVVQASLPAFYAHFEEQGRSANPQLRYFRGSAGFGDLAVRVIRALASTTGAELVLNLPNQGSTAEFAPDTVVETRVHVSRAGVQRLPAPPLPGHFKALARQLERYQRLSARAAAGSGAWAEALAANPLLDKPETAQHMLARARQQYGSLLPARA